MRAFFMNPEPFQPVKRCGGAGGTVSIYNCLREGDFIMIKMCIRDSLKLWEGLGYYSRARNLQKAARQAMERHQGALPPSYEQLLDLSGFGEYTAGAVASIAFSIRVPAVDGNVLRVFSRLLAAEADVANPAAVSYTHLPGGHRPRGGTAGLGTGRPSHSDPGGHEGAPCGAAGLLSRNRRSIK